MSAYTEVEARAKWCPFARVLEYYSENTAHNRDKDGLATSGARCLGSACMAWRWSDPATQDARTIAEIEAPVVPPEGAGWDLLQTIPLADGRKRSYWSREVSQRTGFCGLAGSAP